MLKPLSALLRLTSLALLTLVLASPMLDAAKKKQEETTYEFTIPVEEVPRYLSTEDLREWRRIQRDIKFAKADIQSGKWLEAKEYSAFVEKSRIEADRKKGKDLVANATERLATLTEQENQLRLKADQTLAAQQKQFESQQLNLSIDSSTFAKATDDTTEAMLYKLWNLGYSKLMFAGAYVFQDGYYSKNQPLSENILSTITRIDGNRYTLEEDITEFSLNYVNGAPVVEFEERERMVSKFKPAVLIIEVLYDSDAPSGLYAIHAFDLKSNDLISQIIVSYPIDQACKDLLGIANETVLDTAPEAEDEEAMDTGETTVTSTELEIAPVEEEKASPYNGLNLVLTDDKNFLGRLGGASSNYVFDVVYIGQIDSFDQRAAILLNKAMMRKQGLKVDESEFITLALKPTDLDAEPAKITNAVWRVAPTGPVDYGAGEFSIQAQAKTNNQTVSVDIGVLTVTPKDPGAIPPQASNR